MIDVLDGPGGVDDWAHIDWEKETIWYEESDTTKKLTTKDFIFKRGKYAQSLLSEITDTWYLKFIRDKNPDDYLIEFMFNKRLGELK
jgi:hypothetical protein